MASSLLPPRLQPADLKAGAYYHGCWRGQGKHRLWVFVERSAPAKEPPTYWFSDEGMPAMEPLSLPWTGAEVRAHLLPV